MRSIINHVLHSLCGLESKHVCMNILSVCCLIDMWNNVPKHTHTHTCILYIDIHTHTNMQVMHTHAYTYVYHYMYIDKCTHMHRPTIYIYIDKFIYMHTHAYDATHTHVRRTEDAQKYIQMLFHYLPRTTMMMMMMMVPSHDTASGQVVQEHRHHESAMVKQEELDQNHEQSYPLPCSTHEEVVRDKSLFLTTLQNFLQALGFGLM